jgi:PAS domain S-box-containing protein
MIPKSQLSVAESTDKKLMILHTDVNGVIIGRNCLAANQNDIQVGQSITDYILNASDFQIWSAQLNKNSGVHQSFRFHVKPEREMSIISDWEVHPVQLEQEKIVLVWTAILENSEFNKPTESAVLNQLPSLYTLGNLINAMNEAIFIFDEYGNILSYNDQALDAYADQFGVLQGVFKEDGSWIYGKNIEASDGVRFLHRNVILEGKVYTGQIANYSEQNAQVWRSITAKPIQIDEHTGVLALVICTDISSQKQLEEALVRDRQMFINGPSVLFNWTSQEDWPVEYVSPNVFEQFGYTAAEFISGKLKFKNIVHPDDLEDISAVIEAQKASQKYFYSIEYRIRHANGNYICVFDSSVMIRDKEGKVSYHRGYLIDISDLKKKQADLFKSEQRLALALSAANDGLWDWNIKTKESFWSDRVFQMLDCEPGSFKVTYHKWRSLVHPEDQHSVFGSIRKWLKNKESQDQLTLEYRIRKSDGLYIWMLTRGNIAERDEASVPLRVIGTHADITEKKVSESNVRRSEMMMKTILNSSDEAHFFLSPEGIILGFNSVVENLGPKLLGKPIELGVDIKDYGDPHNDNNFEQKFSRALSGEHLRTEIKIDFNEENSMWLVEKFLPVYDQDDHLVGIALTYDLSFNKIKHQHEKLNEIAFLQSHVIRKPLANILGLLQFLKMGTPDQDYAKVYQYLEKSAEELDQVIGNIISATVE